MPAKITARYRDNIRTIVRRNLTGERTPISNVFALLSSLRSATPVNCRFQFGNVAKKQAAMGSLREYERLMNETAMPSCLFH